MTYPFTPALLDSMPEKVAALYRDLELDLIRMICKQLQVSGGVMNQASVEAIRALRAHGISTKEIEDAIQKMTGMTEKQVDGIFDDVVNWNKQFYGDMLDMAGLTAPPVLVSAVDIEAIRRQCLQDCTNITRSMGFLLDGDKTITPTSEIYERLLDRATLQVQSGAVSYNDAIRGAVRAMAANGLVMVSYASGHRDHADVAARRAIMTGVNQLNQKYRDQSAEYLGTDKFEVTAHLGARNVKGPKGWEAHSEWQGKVYTTAELTTKCGKGDVQGLGGANCRHSYWPFLEGISERTYTDEELEAMKPEKRPKIQYNGKEYDEYQAEQRMREIERSIRKTKRLKTAAEASGDTTTAAAYGTRLRRQNQMYREFSQASGMPMQPERAKVYDNAKSAAAKDLKAGGAGVTIGKGAGVSGALDPASKRAAEHAERYYASVRKMTNDVKRISENTGIPEQDIQAIKNFIFVEKHDLGQGRVARFDASYEMAESWQRLIGGENIQKHDLTLLKHETMERRLMLEGYTQDQAHIMTSKVYDYSSEAEEYYDKVNGH